MKKNFQEFVNNLGKFSFSPLSSLACDPEMPLSENTNWRGRLSKVDLFIKVVCFVKSK